jgi:hypothetical protein
LVKAHRFSDLATGEFIVITPDRGVHRIVYDHRLLLPTISTLSRTELQTSPIMTNRIPLPSLDVWLLRTSFFEDDFPLAVFRAPLWSAVGAETEDLARKTKLQDMSAVCPDLQIYARRDRTEERICENNLARATLYDSTGDAIGAGSENRLNDSGGIISAS